MAQTKTGAEKIAAKKCGISIEEYRRMVSHGQKYCYCCKQWNPVGNYGVDSTRYDKLSATCVRCRSDRAKAKRIQKARQSKKGERFTDIRDGDKKQARYRVNHLIKIGRLANPNLLPCFDCGHTGDDLRHEYDHFAGYSAENQECVQAVCSACHAKRSRKRGEIIQVREANGKFKFKKKGASQP